MIKLNIERKSYLLILLATFLWAVDLIVRYPMSLKYNSIQIVFVESVLGLITLIPWLLYRGKNIVKKLTIGDIFLFTFLGGFGLSVAGYFSTMSINADTPGIFSSFQLIGPFIVIGLAKYFLDERISKTYYTWGICFLLSAILIFSQDLILLFSGEEFKGLSFIVGFTSVIIWGGCTIAAKKLLKRYSPMELVALRWVFAVPFSGLFLYLSNSKVPYTVVGNIQDLEKFIMMSVVAGLLSMFLYYSGLKHLRAGKVAFLELSFPAFGMIISSYYTFDHLTLLQLLGGILFFLFIGLVFFKKSDPVVQIKAA